MNLLCLDNQSQSLKGVITFVLWYNLKMTKFAGNFTTKRDEMEQIFIKKERSGFKFCAKNWPWSLKSDENCGNGSTNQFRSSLEGLWQDFRPITIRIDWIRLDLTPDWVKVSLYHPILTRFQYNLWFLQLVLDQSHEGIPTTVLI